MFETEARETADRERALRIRHSFAAVAEAFIAEKLSRERRGKRCAHELRTVFVAAWGERPVSEITTADVLEIINRKKTVASGSAKCWLVLIRRFFNWAIDQHTFGLTASPCARLSAARIIGTALPRSRKLSDDELFAFWRATGRMRYPVGPVYRFLLLTGLRLNEAARLSWPEIHGDHAIIPAERMKSAREHLVPFSSAAAQIIAEVPRIRGARYVFSCNGGSRPLTLGGKFKRELDRRMLRTLKAMARHRGEDHHAVTLPNWTNHDLRRVVRSAMCAMRIPREVAEAVLAHAAPGIIGVYDTHEYEDEKREALELWARRIADIVNPACRAPPRSSRCRGGDDRVRFLRLQRGQWDQIEIVVRDALYLDADQIERVVIERTVGTTRKSRRPHRGSGEQIFFSVVKTPVSVRAATELIAPSQRCREPANRRRCCARRTGRIGRGDTARLCCDTVSMAIGDATAILHQAAAQPRPPDRAGRTAQRQRPKAKAARNDFWSERLLWLNSAANRAASRQQHFLDREQAGDGDALPSP